MFSIVIHAQSSTAPGEMETPERVIRREIESGLLYGHDHKVLGGMCDAAAVIVTKILGEKNLTVSEIDGVLVVFSAAFAGPSEIVSDREPRTTLFVLKYLELSIKDAPLKKRIEHTRIHTKEQYAKWVKDLPRR